MHLDEEELQRLMHGESVPALGRSPREHMAGCAECRERLRQAERDEGEIHALLRLVDHPSPGVRAESVVAGAVAGGGGWRRWAAGIVLALTLGGVAYAAPGSPVRNWARALLEWGDDAPEFAPLPPPPEMAGLAIAPGPALTVLFRSVSPAGHVRVSLGDGSEVRVRGPVGAATFTSDGGRLAIDNRSSDATFEIEIPRVAPRVEIRVAGERIFLKEGGRVSAAGGRAVGEVYLIPLALPSP
ncbi:MAG: hypothetical protein H0T68_03015 [Gemmatimonadales bacterium]|nr:hypothetical protein [Gemmatimonadales bacterium]